jgi:type III restriction enzyme
MAYLYITGRSRHFFVLAPNLTIYEKLKSDFDPASPKYVFKGVAELAVNPPLIVTGENYESGIAVRVEESRSLTVTRQLQFSDAALQINIFNISKINSEARGGAAPRIKRLQEYIGESYFDYLAGRDDLVLLMDEAHRYRASAGMKAISELTPMLGLELTATPKTIGARPQPFKNVIYSYGLGDALKDGLLKEPAVATRKDFDARGLQEEELDRIKLEDGVHYHEFIKVELQTYAQQTGLPRVKPFMLVVAQDTAHASRIKQLISSDGFFAGAYRDRVIEVHSAQKGEESDEAMQRLLAVEHDERTEIVVHVNKLKEGWDVNNLYTIVPLRSSASEILTEQTLGRGLRLPYGARTGVKALDRLTIIAHDRFQEIIDRANATDSVIKERVYIGEGGDVPATAPVPVEIQPIYHAALTGDRSRIGSAELTENLPATHRIDSADQQRIATVALQVLQRYERLPSLTLLKTDDIRTKVAAEVSELMSPAQAQLPGISTENLLETIDYVVEKVTTTVAELTIEIPNVVVLPTQEVTFGFKDFDLTDLQSVAYKSVSEELLIQQLRDHERTSIGWSGNNGREPRLENYIVRELRNHDEIDYDAHASLLFKLAGQVVEHLRSYLADDDAIENVLIYFQRPLGAFVWAQMERQIWESPTDYRAQITRGFTRLRPQLVNLPPGEQPRNFRSPLPPGVSIRQVLFTGFKKCCYGYQRFDSAEGEQRLAMVLEDDADVVRWMKPGPGQFQIEWKSGRQYEPDFVVETRTEKLILEPKRRNEMADPEVQQKKIAAARWCGYANEHAKEQGGKPWRYALIPHDAIHLGATAVGVANEFGVARLA